MSVNGDFSNLWERLAGARTRRMRVLPPEAAEPTPDGPDLATLVPWVQMKACRDAFLPVLDEEIAKCEVQERNHLRSHADLTYWMGRKEALRDLRATIHIWIGQAQ